jgi:hypothetical protein
MRVLRFDLDSEQIAIVDFTALDRFAQEALVTTSHISHLVSKGFRTNPKDNIRRTEPASGS